MKGGEGDDHLIGNNGNPFGEPLPDTDTALFSGKAKNYTITYNADGSITVTDNVGTDGTDTLQNIERLRFADRMISADGTTTPARGHGGELATRMLCSASFATWSPAVRRRRLARARGGRSQRSADTPHANGSAASSLASQALRC